MIGTNYSWLELTYQTKNGEVLLKYGDPRSTRIGDFKNFFLKVRSGGLMSLYMIHCYEEISLRNIALLRTIGILKQSQRSGATQDLQIPNSLKEDLADILKDIFSQVKITSQIEDEEMFLSKSNENIIDI